MIGGGRGGDRSVEEDAAAEQERTRGSAADEWGLELSVEEEVTAAEVALLAEQNCIRPHDIEGTEQKRTRRQTADEWDLECSVKKEEVAVDVALVAGRGLERSVEAAEVDGRAMEGCPEVRVVD